MNELAKTIARQEIEYLRRLYAKATDMIGSNEPAAVAEGTEIYNRIFTPDVDLRTSDMAGRVNFEAKGPLEWVDVVKGALEEYTSTQHLIGTQIVTLHTLDLSDRDTIAAGEATMESYLQAWHENADDGRLWLFLGTYVDKVRYTKGVGWQISDMTLSQVAGEKRALGAD